MNSHFKNKFPLYIVLAIFCLGCYGNSFAQIKTIPIWEKEIPDEIKNSDYKEVPIYKDSVLQKTSKVTIPTLTIYSPKNPNGTSILIFPGGGYQHLSMYKEGEKIALWLNSLQITAIVVKYRLPDDKIMTNKSIAPLQDAQEAIRIIRRNAENWKLDKNKIGVIGFSAGGHLASTIATRYDEKTYDSKDTTSAKPDFSILIYPVISMKTDISHKGSKTNLLGENPSEKIIEKYSNELQVTAKTPIAFLVHATDDKSVPVENAIQYYLALKKNSVAAEMHLFEKDGHGFGLGENDQLWTFDCIKWLKNHKLL
jgi:acetyl esterase/lipase